MSGFDAFPDELAAICPHTTSKACLYLKDLDQNDLGALRSIVERSFRSALDDALDRNRLAAGGARDVAAGVVGGAVAGGAEAASGPLLPLALALRALTSPNLGSRIAIGMDRTGRVPVVQSGLRGIGMLASHDDE